MDITSSSCQKLAHVKFAHTHCTQSPTKWSKIAPDSTNSTDLQPLTRKFVLKAISLLDFVHFLLKTRSFGLFLGNFLSEIKPEAKICKNEN